MKIIVKGWKGHLHVHPLENGRHSVAFDALSPDGWWVYDTASMTPEQVEKWVGPLESRKKRAGRQKKLTTQSGDTP